ncbi:MAG: isochorismate synthase [Tannerellaceae bacterium]|jgi:isochorismate synthase|nr:isochorismate synthase [Tannerellaceae bacterium]
MPEPTLHRLWDEGCDFAAWRLPNESKAALLHSARTYTYNNMEVLNGRKGFVIYPFSTARHPGVLLEEGICESFEAMQTEPDLSLFPHAFEAPPTEAPADYAERFDSVMQLLRSRHLHKIVLSRSFEYRCTDYPAADAFLLACRLYPRAFVYLCRTQATGCWMGCTPEILLAGEGRNWRTMALAGTATDAASLANEKNSEEQQLVVEYIRSRLASLGIEAEEDGPRAVEAGSGLMHLCTDFAFALPDAQRSGSILRALHPTPAVAGLPPLEAQEAILRSEGYDRDCYTGFVGRLNPEGRSTLCVNLRCMKIAPHSLTLYAGSGLMPASDLQSEWLELCGKLRTMLSLI